MARVLLSRIERQSPITIDNRPLNVSLEPNGLLGFRLKGSRGMIYLPIETAYKMALADVGLGQSIRTRNVVSDPPAIVVPVPYEKHLETLVISTIRKGGTVNVTKLRHTLGESAGHLKAVLKALTEKGRIKQTKPLCYELT